MRWSARMTACLVRAGPIRCSMRGMLCQLMFMPRPISGNADMRVPGHDAKIQRTPPVRRRRQCKILSMAPMVICSISCQARLNRWSQC